MNNLSHGAGVLDMGDGNCYNGEFYYGMMNGVGEYRMSNGDIYEGKMVDNKREGKGRYLWGTGEVFIGEFKDDLMFKGVFRDHDGNLTNIDLN